MYIIFIKIMVACGNMLISLTSLSIYYGSVFVACGSMWDLFIFRATVKLQFSILSHASHWSKMANTQHQNWRKATYF